MNGRAEGTNGIKDDGGVLVAPTVTEAGRGHAEVEAGSVRSPSVPSRYIDDQTRLLGYLAATWQDCQQTRKAMQQRGMEDLAMAMEGLEDKTGERLKQALRQHPVWPWLSRSPGLGGVHTARLISRIGDPRRFPGQKCDKGHTLLPIHAVGSCCAMADKDGVLCGGVMLAPRMTTGTRSLWHFCGLHVVDGRSPRKMKGQRCTWDPIARTAILQPSGIADAIVRNRVPVYRDIYDATKSRLIVERGRAGDGPGIELTAGPAVVVDVVIDEAGGRAERWDVTDTTDGPALRPFQIDAIARKVAAKAFVGDLLKAWKLVVGSCEHE